MQSLITAVVSLWCPVFGGVAWVLCVCVGGGGGREYGKQMMMKCPAQGLNTVYKSTTDCITPLEI